MLVNASTQLLDNVPQIQSEMGPVPNNPKDTDYKMAAMKIVNNLIEGEQGYDIFRGQPRTGLPLLPKAMRNDFQDGNHLEALARFRRGAHWYRKMLVRRKSE